VTFLVLGLMGMFWQCRLTSQPAGATLDEEDNALECNGSTSVSGTLGLGS
jgi:hypothetical protein